jgi:hypothetical protein
MEVEVNIVAWSSNIKFHYPSKAYAGRMWGSVKDGFCKVDDGEL